MIMIETVNDELEMQINAQNADKGFEIAMDASKALSDEANRIRRTTDGSKANAKAIVYDIDTHKVFYTFDA